MRNCKAEKSKVQNGSSKKIFQSNVLERMLIVRQCTAVRSGI